MKRPVEVLWQDSVVGPGTWTTEEDLTGSLPIIHTYGVIVKKSGDSIVVAQSCGEGAVLGTISIPKKSILNIVKLKREEKGK